jgi:hypothetical protein
MPTGNLTSTSPAAGKGRLAMIIAMVPIGIALGFLGGLLIQTIIGVIAVTVSAQSLKPPTPRGSLAHCPSSPR